MKRFVRLSLLLVCLLAPALLRAQFVDKAAASGVDLNFPTSPSGHSQPGLDPYSVGGANCACDIDGDGWTDLIVVRTGAPCLVFINNRDGTFREESAQRGLDTVSDIGGVAAGDLDNDGKVDIFMAPVSGSRYFLFMNDGTGRFHEAAVERGADATVTVESHRSQSVSLVDYDKDGYLDIVVSEWNVLSTGENDRHSALLHNRGRSAPAFFENKTAASGRTQPQFINMIAGYATAWADFDGDGYPDSFLAGDFGTSQMWWNNGDGTFFHGSATSNIQNGSDSMGVTLLDYDGDGRIDIFVSAITLTNESSVDQRGFISDNRLFRNLGGRRFTDVSSSVGVKLSGWGWGAQALDVNNDGWPDLVVTNGYVAPGPNFAVSKTDPSVLFLNNAGTFADRSAQYGITDTGLGRGLAILDYDNDGREDIFITQTEGHRILYHNESSTANAHWLNLRFVGTASNRDGYGCEVTVTAGGRNQVSVYNPTNSYIGQREPRLHFGLGASTSVTKVSIKWPSGTIQELTNVNADQTLTVTESGTTDSPPSAPIILSDPASTSINKDGFVTFTVAAQGNPAPVYNWFKDGERINGASSSTLTIAHALPIDEGIYTVTVSNTNGTMTSRGATLTVTADLAAKSVARWWDEALLDGIRTDTPNPPVHARNLYHISATLWDSFWAYETNGWANHHEIFVKETPALPAGEADRVAAQREAMSYAAYTVIRQRFANSPGSAATTAGIRWLMRQFGLNPDFTDATGSSPASVGVRIGQQILALNLNDGANEAGRYADASGFQTPNPPLIVRNPGVGSNVNPDFWQPLDLVNTITQNGIVLGASVQPFVGANAKNTRTFALVRGANNFVADDPGPPPMFASASSRAQYIREAREVITFSSQLTTADGATVDISPGQLFNNPLGTNDGHGHTTNPVTGRAYDSNVVPRGDYARVLAEFWADGPSSETPPGHWNVLFNQASDHSLATHRFLGTGTALRRIEWDVAGYLALNGGLHDAASAAWTLKWEYNSARPITMIRYLASLGQSSDSSQPSYNADGLPLVPGVVELISTASSAPGQRHEHLAGSVGKIAMKTWLGVPPSANLVSGVGWILGVNWIPYQRDTFVTPAFPGYISGHSTFSRAGAEVLTRFTGSEFFPGGLATYDYTPGTLGFESGPSQRVQLQWATYYDAADQAGLSRLFGGIHISTDDFAGRRMGSKVGIDAFNHFMQLYNPGSVAPIISAQPASATAAPSQSVSFRVAAAAAGNITYQWQRRASGQSSWADVQNNDTYNGALASNLILSSVSSAMSGDSYRAVVIAGGTSVTTDTATLTVGSNTGGGTPAPAPAPSGGGGGGGGGGAPSTWFFGLLLALGAARRLTRRRAV
ncbi:MAG: VCBS repeat-containing protein [Opitutae bacterium]|nr:VCBS repeat-containing protein [Opitutae bacterium]